MPFAVAGWIFIQNRKRPGLRILPEFHDLGHAGARAVMHPTGRDIVIE